MGPPIAPAPQRSQRWMPNPDELPGYPAGSGSPASHGAPVAPASGQRAPGVVVGARYRLVRSLGQSTLTETWEATHVELERAVAIKFLRQAEAGMTERMVEEARTVARVRHPHVVEFSDFGHTELGEPFFVMELLVGQTIEQLLERCGVIPWARSVAIVQQIAEALGAAHQHGIVHRDLRPGNVFLVDTEQVGDFVKVVDFGLARGTTVGGTPGYMSPEQCRGEQLDPRSDVYAIGCLLFAMVTGDPPFVGDPKRVLWQQLNEAPRSLRERAPRQFIPDELEAIVARCLTKLAAQRFADTSELVAELAALAQFSAAASRVGNQVQDPSASGSRPMGFAGRPPPKSLRELTNSYKPVNQPLVDDAPDERPRAPAVASPAKQAGMSAPVIVAATLAGVVAVVGFGVGMYWLVNRLIAEEPAAAEVRQEAAASEPGNAANTQPLDDPTRASAAAGSSPPAESPAFAVEPPAAEAEPAEQASTPPSPTKPSKKSSSKSSDAEEHPPTPEQPPEPEPAPAKNDKPTTEPESKAKDKIGHDELLDPWG